MKSCPYNNLDFKQFRQNHFYYVDKTMHLPQLELQGHYLRLVRPNGFGKTLFLSMMESYYDISMKESFIDLFGDLWIGTRPTPLANQFQVMRLDFSTFDPELENFASQFNTVCGCQLDNFIKKYRNFYDKTVVNEELATDSAEDKLDIITLEAQLQGFRLYLMIDGYDQVFNYILTNQRHGPVPEYVTFEKLNSVAEWYCNFFKLFKGSFERIFMTGIKSLTFNDLTNGYDIDLDISNLYIFNSMLGFEEKEVRRMVLYYKEPGLIKDDIENLLIDMKKMVR